MAVWWAAHWVEVLGFVSGAACVLLAWRRSVWNYPVGMVNTLLFLWLFWDTGIYAQVGLQVVFLALAVAGWVEWIRVRKRESEAQLARDEAFVGSVPGYAVPLLAVALLLCAGGIYWLLTGFTESVSPAADAGTAAGSLVAQFMLNRRWWQCWLVWLTVDVAYVGLFATTGLWITAALYLGFCGMCVSALVGWRRVRAASKGAAAVA